jgi:hypothetical protein
LLQPDFHEDEARLPPAPAAIQPAFVDEDPLVSGKVIQPSFADEDEQPEQ